MNAGIRRLLGRFRSSRLVKETFSYMLINVLEKTVPFLLLPVFSRYLSKEDMGLYILYQAFVQIIMPFVTLSLDQSVVINFYHLTLEKFKEYFSTIFYLFLFAYVLVIGLALILGDQLAKWLEFPLWGIYMILAILFFQYLSDLRQNLWRVQRNPRSYGLFTVGQAILKNGVGFVLVFWGTHDWKGLVMGNLIGVIITALISLVLFYREGYFVFSLHGVKTKIADAFKISLPLSIHRISAWLGSVINRVIIGKKMGAGSAASFGIGSTYYMISNILFDALNKAYGPELYSSLKTLDDTSRVKLTRITFLYYGIIIFVSLGFAAIGYLTVGFIFGEGYASTRDFIVPLTLVAGFNGLYKLHVNYIFYTKKTIFITLITVTTAILNVPLSVYLISFYGLLGACYAMLFVNFTYYVLAIIIANKLIPMYWIKNTKKIIHDFFHKKTAF